jgi:uncharacterized protein (TIGR03067 family)
MNTKRLFALALLGVLLGLGAATQARQQKPDQDLIQGNWTVTKAEENGKSQDELVKSIFAFKDNKVTVQPGPNMTFKLDPTKNPKTIDIQPVDAKEPALGIYELTGDKLRLCIMDPGGARPKEFKAATKGVVVIELTRNK